MFATFLCAYALLLQPLLFLFLLNFYQGPVHHHLDPGTWSAVQIPKTLNLDPGTWSAGQIQAGYEIGHMCITPRSSHRDLLKRADPSHECHPTLTHPSHEYHPTLTHPSHECQCRGEVGEERMVSYPSSASFCFHADLCRGRGGASRSVAVVEHLAHSCGDTLASKRGSTGTCDQHV